MPWKRFETGIGLTGLVLSLVSIWLAIAGNAAIEEIRTLLIAVLHH